MNEFVGTYQHYLAQSQRTPEQIVQATGMPYSLIRSLSEQAKMLSRDEVILLGFAGLRLDGDEVDNLLLTAGYAPLMVQARA